MEAVTTSDRPDLEAEAREVFRVKWPEFVFHDPISRTHIERVESYFPRFDVYLLDKGHVAAGAWAVPLRRDATTADLPDGYDGALVRSVAGHENGEPPTTLCVMAAAVADGRASKGLAGAALAELRRRAEQAGLAHVIGPRPPHPQTPLPTDPDGSLRHLDPRGRALRRSLDPHPPTEGRHPCWAPHTDP